VTPEVARARRRRWAVVAAGTAVLVVVALLGLPGLPVRGATARSSADPAALLARAAASATVAHEGTALTSGTLGLPDLPRLTGVADLVGSTTRTRVWWAGPHRWRVDALTASGERGTYRLPGALTTWDYESEQVVTGPPPQGARLPRTDDLLPPALARGLLSGPGALDAAAAAEVLPARRVAGRTADGVRVAADDDRSTLGAAELWLDRGTGLPLEVSLLDRSGTAVLTSAFEGVRLRAPDAAVLVPPAPAGVMPLPPAPDLAQQADASAPWQLPEELAGLPATAGAGRAGVAAYGSALTRVAVVPLPLRQGREGVRAARAAGAAELTTADYYAEAVLLRAGPLSAAIVDAGDGAHAYLVAGTVGPELVQAAVDGLLDDPLPRREG